MAIEFGPAQTGLLRDFVNERQREKEARRAAAQRDRQINIQQQSADVQAAQAASNIDIQQRQQAAQEGQASQAQQFQQQLGEAAEKGGPIAVAQVYANNGDVKTALEITKTLQGLEKGGLEIDKALFDQDTARRADVVSQVASRIAALPADQRAAEYERLIPEVNKKFGTIIPEAFSSGAMIGLLSSSKVLGDTIQNMLQSPGSAALLSDHFQAVGDPSTGDLFTGILDSAAGQRDLAQSREAQKTAFGQGLQLEELALKQAKAAEPNTKLGKLMAAHDALDDEDPNKALFAKAITKEVEGSGGITVDVDVDTGAKALDKKGKEAARKSIVSKTKRLNQLRDIMGNFNEDSLTFQGKIGIEISRALDKGKLSTEKDRQKLIANSRFLPKVNRLLAFIVKDISGGQVATEEFDRLQKAFISGSLSPVEFMTQTNDLISEVEQEIEFEFGTLEEGLQKPSTANVADMSDDELFNALGGR